MEAIGAISEIARRRNDLEFPATRLQPVINDVMGALHDAAECRLARMSGSGATCFGLYRTAADTKAVVEKLSAQYPGWWVRATEFGV
jgi:4-diphosphocytidyl-2-C-methyl-D-erythritol kinase